MAVMTTVLKEYSNGVNSRTYSLPNHSVTEPEILIQRRRVPVGNQVVASTELQFLVATKDAEGNVLPDKAGIDIKIREPIKGTHADLTALLTIARDVFASDEMTATVDTHNFLK